MKKIYWKIHKINHEIYNKKFGIKIIQVEHKTPVVKFNLKLQC